jgi:hypothetical protein
LPHAQRQFVAGNPGLRDLQERTAHSENITDANRLFANAFYRQVIAELAERNYFLWLSKKTPVRNAANRHRSASFE